MTRNCWWLYLLVCRDGRTYAGIAIDVAARFAAHSSGKGAKFTRSNPPVRVLGAQAFASRSEALKAELALKKLDRTQKLAWARKWSVSCAPCWNMSHTGSN
jgi:putative endonuclease